MVANWLAAGERKFAVIVIKVCGEFALGEGKPDSSELQSKIPLGENFPFTAESKTQQSLKLAKLKCRKQQQWKMGGTFCGLHNVIFIRRFEVHILYNDCIVPAYVIIELFLQ